MEEKNVQLKAMSGDVVYPMVSFYSILVDYSSLEFDTTEMISLDSSTSTAVLGLAIIGQMILGNN